MKWNERGKLKFTLLILGRKYWKLMSLNKTRITTFSTTRTRTNKRNANEHLKCEREFTLHWSMLIGDDNMHSSDVHLTIGTHKNKRIKLTI